MRRDKYVTTRQRTVAVLDIGSSKVRCLIAKPIAVPDWLAEQGQSVQIKVLGFGQHRSRGIKSGVVIDMDAAEQSIRAAVDKAERSAQIMVDDVILSVTCGRIKSDCFTASVAVSGDAAVRVSDIDRVMAAGREYAGRSGRVVLHALPTGYRLDDHAGISDPRGMMGERLSVDVHAVTADELPLRNLMLCVERCHLGVTDLVAAPYASALATIVEDEARLGVTCIDLGAGTTTMAVFAEGQFLYSDAIAIGGNHVSLDIARSLSTPIEDAERIKTLHGSAFATPSDEAALVTFTSVGEAEAPQFNKVTKAQIAEIIRPRIQEILDLVHERVTASGLGPIAGQRVVLSGGGSQLTGLPELANRVLGKSVRVGRPRPAQGLPEGLDGFSLATAIGLVMHSGTGAARRGASGRSHVLGTGTGYVARVSQWIRDSF